MNAPEDECNKSFLFAPTSCEATSYCKSGCCYDGNEGTCMKNTPQKICDKSKGTWSSIADCSIPQCDLGCCLIGDQAAFVTQARCKKLSSLYGIPISFRKDLGSEIQCISSIRSGVKGACVFEKEFERTCLMKTKAECLEMEVQSTETEFYEGKLCTNNELQTNCARSTKTTCVEGKDPVYFLDTCGNVANVYDALRAEDQGYWNDIITTGVCSIGQAPYNIRNCGNCDYFSGTTCKKSVRGDTNSPVLGESICKDLGCTWEGEQYEHGETWCAQSGGVSKIMYNEELSEDDIEEILSTQNVPGSRYFRLVCYNGEVTIEPCADYRQEVCIESNTNVGGGNVFSYAACVANRWSDCLSQDNEKDCNNTGLRDCAWVDLGKQDDDLDEYCVPLYSPGFSNEIDADTCTDFGSTNCIVRYERTRYWGPSGKEWDAKSNEWCDEENANHNDWIDERTMFCNSIGDCGIAANYMNVPGYYIEDDVIEYSDKLKNRGKVQTYIEGLENE